MAMTYNPFRSLVRKDRLDRTGHSFFGDPHRQVITVLDVLAPVEPQR